MARPKKPIEVRAKRREIYVQDAQWAQIAKQAEAHDLTISRYLVNAGAAIYTPSKDTTNVLFELGRMQSQLEEVAAAAGKNGIEDLRLLTVLMRIENHLARVANAMRRP